MSDHRVRARLRILAAGTAAALAVLACAQTASAASGPAQYADGLHVSTGGITAPDGSQWVSDHNAGFCRLTAPVDAHLGTIDHPQLPGAPQTDPRTCLGGLLPDAAPGPDAAGQPVFYDPSPDFPDSGDELALIPDGAAPSREVYRAHWNRHTRLFEIDPGIDVIEMDADTTQPRPRPNSIALGPDGNAYVTGQRTASIQRISNLDAPAPTVDLVGFTSDGVGAQGVAAGYGPFGPLGPVTVYVSQADGLREIAGVPGSGAAQPTTYGTGGATVGPLQYVPTDTLAGRGVLYGGTIEATPDAPAVDRVLRLEADGTTAVVAGDFSTVGGFGLRPQTAPPAAPMAPEDRLVIYDDPALVQAGEPLGHGRAWTIGAPFTQLLTGPTVPADQPPLDTGYTADATPTFTYSGEGVVQCSLVRADLAANSFAACDDPSTYTAATLTNDTWRFAVRSVRNGVQGAAATRTFTVDTLAPTAKPIVVNPDAGSASLRAPRYVFDSDDPSETLTGFECQVDDLATTEDDAALAYEPCDEGIARKPGTHTPLPDGRWSVQMKLVDAAGNVGTAVSDGVPTAADDPGTPADESAGTTGDQPTSFEVGRDPIADADATDPVAYPELTHPGSAVRYAEGLHVSTGAMEDPAGRVWVADHNGGFCRVTDPTTDGPGAIDHPQVPGRPRTEPRTCLGGLLPGAGPGADAAGPPTFYDPTPRKKGNGDELVFIADGFAQSNYLVRFRWDPGTERFDYVDQILVPAVDRAAQDRARPVTSQLGPDPDGAGPDEPSLYFSNKRDSYLGRVDNLTAEHPDVHVAGFVSPGGDRAEVLAVGQRTDEAGRKHAVLYTQSQNGLERLRTPREQGEPDAVAGRPGVHAEAFAVTGVTNAGAMAYDLQRDLLYLGTAEGVVPADAGTDRFVRWDPNAAQGAGAVAGAPIRGFSMIGGIGLRNDGRILVVDDKALLDAAEPLGAGIMYQVGGPAARVTSGPSNVPGQTALDASYTADATPDFGLAGDQALQCWFRDAGSTAAPAFTPCTAATVTAPNLGQGEKLLTVRSTAGATPETQEDTTRFVPVTVRYTVDSAKPAAPATPALQAGELVNGRTSAEPSLRFGGVEAGNRIECRLVNSANTPNADTYNKAPCRQGKAFPRTGTPRVTDGTNRVSARQIDLAGNASPASAQLTFLADAVVPTVTITAPAADGQTVGTEAQFTFRTDDTGTVRYGCRLDGATFKRCDRPVEDAGGPGQPFAIERLQDGSTRVTYRNLVEGEHRFSVHAADEHNNISPNASRTVNVDLDAPVAIIDAPAPNAVTGRSTTLVSHIDPSTIGDGETNTLACTLTRGTTPVALPECDGNIAVSGLQEGQHTFTVRATDSAGNVGPVASRTWRVDVTGPVITITQTGGIVNPPTFSFTSSEPAALLCAFDAQPLRDCATLSTATLTRFTNHTIRVQGTDAFGNVGTASRTFFLGLFRTAPAAPSAITVASVLDQATAQSTGVPVALTTGANTAITRFVVTPAPGTTTAAGAAASKRLALVYRKTPKAKRRYRLHLNERRLRKALTPGRYRVEIRAVSPSNKLSHAKYKTFRVKR